MCDGLPCKWPKAVPCATNYTVDCNIAFASSNNMIANANNRVVGYDNHVADGNNVNVDGI